MKAELSFLNQQIQLKISGIIKANKKAVWYLLTTTEGYKRWFPEIQADNLPTNAQLLFDVSGIVDTLPLLIYDAPNTLKYGWSDATVNFDLRDLGNDLCEIHFTEIAPYSFPDLLRDITGWTLQLNHLQAAAENKPYTFDQVKFDQIEASYHEQLTAHNFYE